MADWEVIDYNLRSVVADKTYYTLLKSIEIKVKNIFLF
mgnify:CR=1 FL=1|jgi:hypothetical protein